MQTKCRKNGFVVGVNTAFYKVNKRKILHIILCVAIALVVLLPYPGAIFLYKKYSSEFASVKNARFIIADKSAMTLTLYDYHGDTVLQFPMACGKAFGDKQKQGDMRTPEGVFRVESVEDASAWTHDFGDGKGEVDGAYGPLFIRLQCPNHKGIGIHGTHLPQSIGTRATEGCIRLNNKDLLQLSKYVHAGMVVAVLPSKDDALEKIEL